MRPHLTQAAICHFTLPPEQDFDFRALHRANRSRYPFLLQSTTEQSQLGRYDILFAYPQEELVLDSAGALAGPEAEQHSEFLRGLDAWWDREKTTGADIALPFHGGWFLYLSYELAAEVESSLTLERDRHLPVAFAVRCPAAFIRDHKSGDIHVICEVGHDTKIEEMLLDANAASEILDRNPDVELRHVTEADPSEFLRSVDTAKQYIVDGDVFQANLSRSWKVDFENAIDVDEVYRRLCTANPAPFAGSVYWRGVNVLSSSPERLITIREREISTRPIAGTRPRGATVSSDDALSLELIDHPKERAEHVMLIDLERNDLGRVCVAGTVEVNELMVLESYAHVHHIVSNVKGTLSDGVTPGDAIRAVFPGGTITGCPKVRCMEIISELESSPRGAYTGSFGYLNRDGNLDLNILIRTMVISKNGIEFKAGCGIVADSNPIAELEETRAKAKGLLMALQ